MSTRSDVNEAVRVVNPDLLRGWPLPAADDSKYGRGQSW